MSAFDDLFDRVVVVNLDRRPDRMALVAAQLDALGVSYAASPRSTVGGPVTQAWRPMRRSPCSGRRRRRRSGATATSIWATAPRPRGSHSWSRRCRPRRSRPPGLGPAGVDDRGGRAGAGGLGQPLDPRGRRPVPSRHAGAPRRHGPIAATGLGRPAAGRHAAALGGELDHLARRRSLPLQRLELRRPRRGAAPRGAARPARALSPPRPALRHRGAAGDQADLPAALLHLLPEPRHPGRQRQRDRHVATVGRRDHEAGNVYRWHYPDYGIEAIMGNDRTFKGGMRRARASLAAARRAIGGALGRNPSAPPVATAKPLPARSPESRRGSAWRRWANWVRAAPARSSWPSWSAPRRTSMPVPWRCSVVS